MFADLIQRIISEGENSAFMRGAAVIESKAAGIASTSFQESSIICRGRIRGSIAARGPDHIEKEGARCRPHLFWAGAFIRSVGGS